MEGGLDGPMSGGIGPLELAIIAVYIVLCVLVGAYAGRKGRSAGNYTVASIVITPVLGFLAAVLAKDKPSESRAPVTERTYDRGYESSSGDIPDPRFSGGSPPAAPRWLPTRLLSPVAPS